MKQTGKIMAVCISGAKGTPKKNVGEGRLIAGHGLEGDAHAGTGIRQISLLSFESVEDFNARGAQVEEGSFGENLLIGGIDPAKLALGTVLCCGDARLRVTQHGKECHSRCAIYERMGDCLMPRKGVFAEVLQGGTIQKGDECHVEEQL